MTSTSWVPLVGEFDIAGNEVRFLGKKVPTGDLAGGLETERKDQPSVGLAVSNRTLTDGKISADVEFAEVTGDSFCGLSVVYDVNGSHFISAGLGSAPWAMFGIREYGGSSPLQWRDHRMGGDRANLKPGRIYRIEVQLRGASVSLCVDGVAVGEVEIPLPMGRPHQIGVFCRADHLITVRNFAVEGVKPKAFVVMQFGAGYDAIYDDVVKEICDSYDVTVLRADEVSGPGLIISDIVWQIATSQLIIADITPINPNVYFEVGYALARGIPTILLAQKGTSLPFDVAGFRVLFYDDTIGGKKKLEEGMKKHLAAILAA